jgi:hypothetical protein
MRAAIAMKKPMCSPWIWSGSGHQMWSLADSWTSPEIGTSFDTSLWSGPPRLKR